MLTTLVLADATLGSFVAPHKKRLCFCQIIGIANRNLQIACSPVIDLANIASESLLSAPPNQVNLDENDHLSGGWVNFQAGEVLNSLKGDVQLKFFHLNVITERLKGKRALARRGPVGSYRP